jgi:lipopolysaccharide transport system permease protein
MEKRDRPPPLHIKDGRIVDARHGRVAGFFRFLGAPFKAVWHHRDLIAAILRRELRERFKGSAAGWVWALFAPLLSLTTYVVAFSGSIQLRGTNAAGSPIDYALFIFGGLVAFNFFSEMAYRAPALLHEYSHYIKQTMFPAEMLAVISTARATVYALISLAVMLACHLVMAGFLHWTVVLLPLWCVAFVAFLIGLTWLLSALGAFTRDTAYFVMTVMPLMMFATPVFYSQESLSPGIRMLMYANVLTGFIEIIRDLAVLGTLPGLAITLWTVFLSAGTFWLGYWFFTRTRDRIIDVI